MFLVLSILLVATATAAWPVVRLLSARRRVLAAREGLGAPGPTGGHPSLQTARNALLAADGWLDSGSRLLFWELLGRRTRDERQIVLLRAAEALGQARLAARRGGLRLEVTDIPTLCDPIAEHRLRGWWPVTAVLERMPRILRGVYCWSQLRGPIGKARLATVEMLRAVDAALDDTPSRTVAPMDSRRAMFAMGTARHLLASAAGEVRHARRRLIWEALGLDRGERREQHLLEAASQAGAAHFLGERASRALGAPVELPAVFDSLDPVVALGVQGRWLGWAVLTLAPAPIRGAFRWSRLAGPLKQLELDLVEAQERLTAVVVELRAERRSLPLAAK